MRLRPQVLRLIVPVIFVPVLCGCSMALKEAAVTLPMVAGTDDAPARAYGFTPSPAAGVTLLTPSAGSRERRKAQEQPSAHLAADKGPDTAVPATQRMLIYSGQWGMAVADVESSMQATRRLAEEVGGYMLTMSANTITIRVPAKQFFPVLDRLKALGQIISRNINAQDVTDEYTDLQLRLKNAEALRDRLVAILEKAANVKDTLEVERELNRVREEIERIKGRIAQLDKLIAYSTIEVVFTQAQDRPAKVRRPQTPFPWLDRLGVETVLDIRG